jgi:hypothetical protein
MRDLINFQIQTATGRLTLPVTILVCLSLWAFTFGQWTDLFSLGTVACIGYLMIEANTTFTLIRTRTSLPVSIYSMLATALFFLHPWEWDTCVPLTFILAVFLFFRSYESPNPVVSIYNTYLAIGTCSLVFPPIVYYVPLFFLGMIPFRSLNGKSFCALLLGLATPYWFLLGYACWTDNIQCFLYPLKEMVTFVPISYQSIPLHEIASWIVVGLLLTISSIHYFHRPYADKTRTRIFHSFLIYAGWWTTLLSVLMPAQLHALLPIQGICAAFLCGHLFTLTRNLFSGIFFIVTFAALISLTVYNLWMQFFNS